MSEKIGNQFEEFNAPKTLESLGDKLAEQLTQGSYCNVIGALPKNEIVIARAMSQLEKAGAPFFVDIRIPPEGWGGIGETEEQQNMFGIVLPAIQKLNLTPEELTELSYSATDRTAMLLESVIKKLSPDQRLVCVVQHLDYLGMTPDDLKKNAELLRAVRSMFLDRPSDPLLKQLSWVLSGTQAPSYFLPNDGATEYNIGHEINTPGYTPPKRESESKKSRRGGLFR